jgi:acyl-CoA thioesterase-2
VALNEPPASPAEDDDLGCGCPHGAHIPPCGIFVDDAPEPEVTELGAAPRAHRATWMRLRHDLSELPPETAALWHSALLAYESDMGTLGVVDKPHDHEPGRRKAASVDHAMWFHRPFRADDWVWYWQRSPVFTGGRGTFEGSFYDTAGRLVASCAQEVSIRRTVR